MEPGSQQGHRDGPNQVPRVLRIFSYAFVSIGAAALLVLHTIGIAGLEIDTTSLGLLALLLLVPLAPNIRRLRAAGVEAEIGQAEARQLQAAASELPLSDQKATDADPEIQELIERDPPLGLAKLRIELESELRRLCLQHAPEAKARNLSLGAMAAELQKRDLLPSEIAEPLSKVSTLTNRAVHGEYVPPDVASDIGQVGIRVLSALRHLA